MKYWSDVLNEKFDTLEELSEAEGKYEVEKAEKEAAAKKASEERKARAKEVEDAFKAANEAKKHADELLKKFTEDYNTFHFSIKSVDSAPSIFNWLFDSFTF